MANMTIKGVPDDVYRVVKKRAATQGRTLNGYVIHLLECEAAESARHQRMRESWESFKKFRDTLPYMSDSTELIREDRDSR